jgi:hypothetical protein
MRCDAFLPGAARLGSLDARGASNEPVPYLKSRPQVVEMVLVLGRWILALVIAGSGAGVFIREGVDGTQLLAMSPPTGSVLNVDAAPHNDGVIGVYEYYPIPSAEPQLYWFFADAETSWYGLFLPAQGLPLVRPHITIDGATITICGNRTILGRQQVICWAGSSMDDTTDKWRVTTSYIEPRRFFPMTLGD